MCQLYNFTYAGCKNKFFLFAVKWQTQLFYQATLYVVDKEVNMILFVTGLLMQWIIILNKIHLKPLFFSWLFSCWITKKMSNVSP